MRYKTVRVAKQYALQNGMHYKTVRFTKRYVTKRCTLQNSTLFILCYEGTNPWIGWAFALTLSNPGYGEAHPVELHLSMDQLGICPNLI
jgi:hypothetical protein